MRPLLYIMTPVLILTIILASRFVTWDAIKGAKPQAQADVPGGDGIVEDMEDSRRDRSIYTGY